MQALPSATDAKRMLFYPKEKEEVSWSLWQENKTGKKTLEEKSEIEAKHPRGVEAGITTRKQRCQRDTSWLPTFGSGLTV